MLFYAIRMLFAYCRFPHDVNDLSESTLRKSPVLCPLSPVPHPRRVCLFVRSIAVVGSMYNMYRKLFLSFTFICFYISISLHLFLYLSISTSIFQPQSRPLQLSNYMYIPLSFVFPYTPSFISPLYSHTLTLYSCMPTYLLTHLQSTYIHTYTHSSSHLHLYIH